MEKLFKIIGSDRRYFSYWIKREKEKQHVWNLCYPIIGAVRKDHPSMGLRSIWDFMKIENLMGRDQFIEIAKSQGLALMTPKRYKVTTKSTFSEIGNKIKGKKLTGVNQVWVSDITFYYMKDRFYFLTFILDLFSRIVVSYNVSRNLESENTSIPCIEYAIKSRLDKNKNYSIIFHSDAGGQYIDKVFISKLIVPTFTRSISGCVYENAVMERFNRTIKRDYIEKFNPNSFEALKKYTMLSCFNYNNRPHRSLNKLSPIEFESKQKGV